MLKEMNVEHRTLNGERRIMYSANLKKYQTKRIGHLNFWSWFVFKIDKA